MTRTKLAAMCKTKGLPLAGIAGGVITLVLTVLMSVSGWSLSSLDESRLHEVRANTEKIEAIRGEIQTFREEWLKDSRAAEGRMARIESLLEALNHAE